VKKGTFEVLETDGRKSEQDNHWIRRIYPRSRGSTYCVSYDT